MSVKQCFSIVLLLVVATVGYCAKSGSVTLDSVRELVARNEALLNPIKMAYTVKMSQTGERPQPLTGSRRAGRRYSHIKCVWAQAGEKHYTREDCFYGPDEPARSSVKVFDEEVKTQAKLPNLMEGTISPRDNHDWYSVLVAKLGLRPFEGHYTLSQILVPELASLHEKTEMIDGREAYVIDAKRPSVHPYFARLWIDRQRGLPLRIWYFDRHPNWDNARLSSEINDIKFHLLPNGARIPTEGVRSVNFSDGNVFYEHMKVDVHSITIRREDIPESLFKIDFPDDARIYNAISGLTSLKGRQRKPYEHVIAGGGTYIAGTVTDERGTPIPEVVVGPLVVKTQQSDGRVGARIINGRDRSCAITDVKGRFAIELEEEGAYELWFLPEDFVDMRVREVSLGMHDLKVTLRKGGTVTGRVMRFVDGYRVPVANVEVTAKEGDRAFRATLRRHRMRTKTDSEGRFQIRYLDMLMPKRRTGDSKPPQYAPSVWQIGCGSVSETVLFEDGQNIHDVELMLKPDLREAIPLINRTLYGFEGIKIDLTADQTKDKMMLVCFFDMNQRPSRNCVIQLAQQTESLKQQGISLAAVQAVKVDENTLSQFRSESNIPFPVGMIQGDEEWIRFHWAICSLPWLILTDKAHVVRAEGVGLSELNRKIQEINRD